MALKARQKMKKSERKISNGISSVGIKYSVCDRYLLPSTITVLRALVCEKGSVYDQIVIKNLNRRKDE